ncbi:MAG TPA: DNA-3-methyladenine glycosylase 2 family protein [Actinomycetota bacterium]
MSRTSDGPPPDASAIVTPALPVDLALTFGQIAPIGRDPGLRREATTTWWRATRTPEGPATVRYSGGGYAVAVRAWGPGAEWAVEFAPEAIGATDSLQGFEPGRGLVGELHRRFPGLRIPRTRAVFEALVPSVLAQKVTGAEAGAARRRLMRAWGEPAPAAPGAPSLRVLPEPDAIARRPYHEFHPLGIERRRAKVLSFAAARAPRLEETVEMTAPDAQRRLMAFPGIGPWTAAEVAGVALGDADAVSVGDFHIPNTVAWALRGEPRGDDAAMLEALQPYAGHRGRVIRLIEAAGIRAPRFGPRSPVRSMRSI